MVLPKFPLLMSNVNSPRSMPKFRLHPSIHTLLLVNLAQSIVALSQEAKCGLKYDIHTSTSSVRTLDQNDTALAKKKAPTYQKKCVGEGLKGVRSIDS